MPGGAPKGNKNRKGKIGPLGIPPLMMTNQLHKALKQFERVDPDDPKRNVKQGQAVRVIMDQIVEKAVDGDMSAINFCIERMEGKPRQVTESVGTVDVKHTGFSLEFVAPIDVTPKRELIEH